MLEWNFSENFGPLWFFFKQIVSVQLSESLSACHKKFAHYCTVNSSIRSINYFALLMSFLFKEINSSLIFLVTKLLASGLWEKRVWVMAKVSSWNYLKITMSKRKFLQYFLVKTLEDAFSEPQKQFSTFNGIPFRSK